MPVTPFRAADLAAIDLQDSQRGETQWRRWPEIGAAWEAAGNAFTWRADDGRVLFCGGAIEHHPGYASLWGAFSMHRPRVPVWLTRTVRRFVAELPHRRVDATVSIANERACGWLHLIGLEFDARLAEVGADGSDVLIYRRTRR